MHAICYWLLVFCNPAGNCYFLHTTLQTKKAKPKLTFLYCTGNYSSQQLYLNKLYLKMGTRTWCLAFFFVSPTPHKNKNWEPLPNFYWYFVLHFLAIGQHQKSALFHGEIWNWRWHSLPTQTQPDCCSETFFEWKLHLQHIFGTSFCHHYNIEMTDSSLALLKLIKHDWWTGLESYVSSD